MKWTKPAPICDENTDRCISWNKVVDINMDRNNRPYVVAVEEKSHMFHDQDIKFHRPK